MRLKSPTQPNINSSMMFTQNLNYIPYRRRDTHLSPKSIISQVSIFSFKSPSKQSPSAIPSSLKLLSYDYQQSQHQKQQIKSPVNELADMIQILNIQQSQIKQSLLISNAGTEEHNKVQEITSRTTLQNQGEEENRVNECFHKGDCEEQLERFKKKEFDLAESNVYYEDLSININRKLFEEEKQAQVEVKQVQQEINVEEIKSIFKKQTDTDKKQSKKRVRFNIPLENPQVTKKEEKQLKLGKNIIKQRVQKPIKFQKDATSNQKFSSMLKNLRSINKTSEGHLILLNGSKPQSIIKQSNSTKLLKRFRTKNQQ